MYDFSAGYAPNYYDPSSAYGAANGGDQSSPFSQYYGNISNPQAGFMGYLAQQGYSPFTTYGRWAQGQQNDLWNSYQAALMNNPMMGWAAGPNNFLSGVNLQQQYLNSTPSQRGLMPGWMAGRAQWIGR